MGKGQFCARVHTHTHTHTHTRTHARTHAHTLRRSETKVDIENALRKVSLYALYGETATFTCTHTREEKMVGAYLLGSPCYVIKSFSNELKCSTSGLCCRPSYHSPHPRRLARCSKTPACIARSSLMLCCVGSTSSLSDIVQK